MPGSLIVYARANDEFQTFGVCCDDGYSNTESNWNPVTGLGSPRFDILAQLLTQKLPRLPKSDDVYSTPSVPSVGPSAVTQPLLHSREAQPMSSFAIGFVVLVSAALLSGIVALGWRKM